MSMMSVEAFKECVGKRCLVLHDEGEPKPHSVIGRITSADENVLIVVTDYNVRNIIPLRCILKVKEIGDNSGEEK